MYWILVESLRFGKVNMLYYWVKCLIFKEFFYIYELNELLGKFNKLLGGCFILRSFLGVVFVFLGKTFYF